MSATRNYLALDLGASGGRAIIGRFDGERLALEEVHRFANGPVHIPSARGDSLHWDTLRLFAEIQEGLKKAVACCGSELISLGIDTWGVDYGLLDRNDRLVGLPYHYRDSRNDSMMAEAFRRVSREDIFAATGIQFMQLNSLFQLLAQQAKDPEVLARHAHAPDDARPAQLLADRAEGQRVHRSPAPPSARSHRPAWATGLLEKIGIPTHCLPAIVQPGTVSVACRQPYRRDRLGAVPCIAPAATTPAARSPPCPPTRAYAADPARHLVADGRRDEAAGHQRETLLAFNVTNEGGVCGTFRLLKNIMGLWIVQECRRTWAAEGQALSWADIVRHATAARPFVARSMWMRTTFLAPGDMPARIREYCRRTEQLVPEGVGSIARVVYESLA